MVAGGGHGPIGEAPDNGEAPDKREAPRVVAGGGHGPIVGELIVEAPGKGEAPDKDKGDAPGRGSTPVPVTGHVCRGRGGSACPCGSTGIEIGGATTAARDALGGPVLWLRLGFGLGGAAAGAEP